MEVSQPARFTLRKMRRRSRGCGSLPARYLMAMRRGIGVACLVRPLPPRQGDLRPAPGMPKVLTIRGQRRQLRTSYPRSGFHRGGRGLPRDDLSPPAPPATSRGAVPHRTTPPPPTPALCRSCGIAAPHRPAAASHTPKTPRGPGTETRPPHAAPNAPGDVPRPAAPAAPPRTASPPPSPGPSFPGS